MSAIRHREPEEGFTIVELAVTVLLLGIVVAVLFAFLDSTTSVTAKATRNVEAEQAGQLALRTISQDVRSANPVVATYPPAPTSCAAGGSFPAAYATCLPVVMVRSDVTGPTCTGPDGFLVQAPYSRITYALAGGRVLQDRTDYSSTCAVTRSYTGRVIIDQVVNGAGSPLFTLLDRSGNVTAAATNAASVRIALEVRYHPRAGVLDLASTVALRNYR
ncbi:MAG: PulJ/GspJ family protein [Acidimicrobiales bacterium]